jgi:hypothetical protein
MNLDGSDPMGDGTRAKCLCEECVAKSVPFFRFYVVGVR